MIIITSDDEILTILKQLQEGQKKATERLNRMESDIKSLIKDTKELKRNLNYVWDSVNRIDD
ncbi:hypothetical protein [Desulfosporosinus sp. SB140]|uniref:hypothetical protein n=1 Tax=Desulfosporosinus paludis TaxID=3115649 RepID=UPI0038900C84